MNKTNSFPIIRYKQQNQEYISLIIPFQILYKISKVLIYGIDDDGYQRKPNKVHLNRIKNDALKSNNFRLPTSIILGVDEDVVEEMLKNSADPSRLIDIDVTKQVFRIVDGQHRIYGLWEASKEKSELLDFPLNVIIIISQEKKRSVELEVFTDINSKSKRINTDLAELAKHDYQIKEEVIENNEVSRHIAIKTAFFLKSEGEENIWRNAIKFDIHSEISLGIIGVTIFSESIKSIIDKYILDVPYSNNGKDLEGQPLIEYCNNSAKVIGAFLSKVWNDVVKIKWGKAFREDIVKNDEGEIVKIFYSKDFYIQKGLGAKAINFIIGESVKEHGLNEKAEESIQKIIFDSKVKIDDWRNGGPFSGYNSESGFRKIREVIKNMQPVP
ncbi:DGQHR domain-containing protein [Dyadobacter aurulentus]|uniref:DGQHR domain-containing protein n=1 Tax=Dyadobacter sp. UC 10 TaxID=2605428 RepID=UPI0011F23706|nr:DGQHR domain-containing protein [Dyadobacter sp. UC 10]KAA0990408.1 DGQHR domain-containing protein [Dyadobacter sp. UC 10]